MIRHGPSAPLVGNCLLLNVASAKSVLFWAAASRSKPFCYYLLKSYIPNSGSGQSNMDFSVAPWGGGGCLKANETVAAAGSGRLDDIRMKKGTILNPGGWFNSSTAAINRQGVLQKGYVQWGHCADVCVARAKRSLFIHGKQLYSVVVFQTVGR